MHRYPMTDDERPRDIQIDGLRALLSFGIMTIHYLGIRPLIMGGVWNVQSVSKITLLLGNWTVPIFFGITAYLFSQRLIRSENYQGRSTLKFLTGRLFRLTPMSMLACLLFLLANTSAYTNISDSHSLIQNWKGLVNAALGSFKHPTSGPNTPFVEPWAWGIACGPQWTLHFEWIFYLSLASLPIVSLKRQTALVSILSICVLMFFIVGTASFYVNWGYMTWAFIPGLVVGLASKYWTKVRNMSHPLTATVAITAVLASAFHDKLQLKVPANTLFLAVILSNNRATRILESKLLRSLGETTYSVYLLHGLVQYATLKWIVTIPIARSMPEWLWWMTCALQVIFIVIIARLSFEYVEKPGIEAGKRFYAWLMNLIERRAEWLLNWI